MTIVDWLYFKKNAFVLKIRAFQKFYFFKKQDIKLGHNVIIKHGKGKHSFGFNNVVLDNCIFEVHNSLASITTGNGCIFSYGVIVVCHSNIKMGNNVWIGEYSSLRDSTHQFSTTSSLGTLPDTTKPIIIGNNVWIGRGCLIMPGTIIEDNVIIAANSVVKTACSSGKVYGGCPAVFIKNVN